jgi:DNA-binding IclR family transcriptional regulator
MKSTGNTAAGVGPGAEVPQGQMARRDPIARAVQAIEFIASGSNNSAGVRELARHLDISPSSAQGLLVSLARARVIEKDIDDGGYVFTRKFASLAKEIGKSKGCAEIARESLARLARESSETALLGEYDYQSGLMMFTEMVESVEPVRFVASLHEWMPVHIGASGFAIMAFLAPAQRDRALASARAAMARGPLPWQTMQELNEVLAAVQQAGYAVTVGQRARDAVGIFVPIFENRKVIGDIGLNVPLQRFENDQLKDLVVLVRDAARSVEEKLG